MKTKVIRIEIKFTRATLTILLGSLLLLVGLMGVGNVLAQDPETEFPPLPPGMEGMDADEAAALETLAIASNVASKISYQGRLTDPDGNPLNGAYDMIFQLRDAETGGNMVGSAINKTGVTVEDGLFEVELSVNPDNFSGRGLWLEITVGGETLTPAQQILPAPYALSLRPGAIISDTGSYVELNKFSPGTFPSKSAVYGKTSSGGSFKYGVRGDGVTAGVFGYSDTGNGVYAYSNSGTALYAYGDAKQNLTSSGMVKAAVYTTCKDGSPSITRSFNNVNSNSITVAGGASNGQCTIDFNFSLSNRYWAVTAVSLNYFKHTTCAWHDPINNPDQLACACYTASGAGSDCTIIVQVY